MRYFVITLVVLVTCPSRLMGAFLVDPTNPIYGLYVQQFSPAIAGGRYGYFAVWDDGRNESRSVYGTRISPDGYPLDTCGILITTVRGSIFPDIAYGYTSSGMDNYLVVWVDSINVVRGVRISGGNIIGDVITISTAEALRASVSYAPSYGYMVVWATMSEDIHGARVTVDGNVLGTFVVYEGPGTEGTPKISYDGDKYLVVWFDNRTGVWKLYGSRITPLGNILDPGGRDLIGNTINIDYFDVAFGGGYWFLVWRYSDSTSVYGARVDTSGTCRDIPPLHVISGGSENYNYPAVSYSNGHFIVVSTRDLPSYTYSLQLAVVDTSGSIISSNYAYLLNSPKLYDLDLAFSDTIAFVLWRHYQPSLKKYGICGKRVTMSGNFPDPYYDLRDVGIVANSQVLPVAEFGGDSILVIWKDDFYGLNGELIDSAGNPVNWVPGGGPLTERYALTFNGNNYFFVWFDMNSNTVKGLRISREGNVVGSDINISPILTGAALVATASTQDFYGVSWSEYYPPRVMLCILNSDGNIVVAPTDVSNITNTDVNVSDLSVSADSVNGRFAIAWSETDLMVFIDSCFLSIVSEAGGVINSRISLGEKEFVSLVNNGESYFAIAYDSYQYIKGVWINYNGAIIDSCEIPVRLERAKLCACNEGYFIVGTSRTVGDSRVLGYLLNVEGELIDSFDFGSGKEAYVSSNGNNAIVTWRSFTPYPYSSFRIWGEIIPVVAISESYDHKGSLAIKLEKLIFENEVRAQIEGLRDGDYFIIELFDPSGRIVHRYTFNKTIFAFGNELRRGIYFVRAVGKGLGASTLQKVIKVR